MLYFTVFTTVGLPQLRDEHIAQPQARLFRQTGSRTLCGNFPWWVPVLVLLYHNCCTITAAT